MEMFAFIGASKSMYSTYIKYSKYIKSAVGGVADLLDALAGGDTSVARGLSGQRGERHAVAVRDVCSTSGFS
jgi:hypothetical protein